MQPNLNLRLQRKSYWLSILLHAFLFLLLSLVILSPPQEVKKSPQLYLPSYLYQSGSTSASQHASVKKTPIKHATNHPKLALQRADSGIPSATHVSPPGSMLAASLATLKQSQLNSLSMPKTADPILLIGDENTSANPLVKLLAQSLSAHFFYPETEGMLGIKGRVLIALTLHPAGHFTDIQLIKSSENQHLDAAALHAANAAPLVVGANRFLSSPKRFVVGFVFY